MLHEYCLVYVIPHFKVLCIWYCERLHGFCWSVCICIMLHFYPFMENSQDADSPVLKFLICRVSIAWVHKVNMDIILGFIFLSTKWTSYMTLEHSSAKTRKRTTYLWSRYWIVNLQKNSHQVLTESKLNLQNAK